MPHRQKKIEKSTERFDAFSDHPGRGEMELSLPLKKEQINSTICTALVRRNDLKRLLHGAKWTPRVVGNNKSIREIPLLLHCFFAMFQSTQYDTPFLAKVYCRSRRRWKEVSEAPAK